MQLWGGSQDAREGKVRKVFVTELNARFYVEGCGFIRSYEEKITKSFMESPSMATFM